MILNSIRFPELPLTDPIPIFLLVLLIILVAPMLNRIKIPHIIGLIIAGMVFGPHGLNVLAKDQSFELFGEVGILYIMFQSGLEVDMNTFKQNSKKGILFGLYTFFLPMIIGTVTSMYILNFDFVTSVLLSSMYASHTLIAYPIVSKMGIAKHRAISITVVGTIITVVGALLVLAVIVARATGEMSAGYWGKFGVGTVIFGIVVFWLIPYITKLFLKLNSDNVAQYIFVLAMVFFASWLAAIVGLEGIIGAFFAGLVLNRLIPSVSPLMNRIEFVGNAIFIPFFLIGIGMMIDLRVFFTGGDALLVAVTMSVVATFTKWLAAWLTEKSCRLTKHEGNLIFGLSNAQAAATLAAVMIGYNLGLLNLNVLNGTIVMILVTCTISSIVTEKAARAIALADVADKESDDRPEVTGQERILVPISNPQTMPQLIELSNLIKDKNNKKAIYALSINSINGEDDERKGKLMESAAKLAASTDSQLTPIVKRDINVANCIVTTAEEYDITDVLVGVHQKSNIVDTFYGNVISSLLKSSDENLIIYGTKHPVSDVKRLVVAVPDKAEFELGFPLWFERVKNIASQLGISVLFFASQRTTAALKEMCGRQKLKNTDFKELESWEDFLIVTQEVRPHDTVIIISARKSTLSYHPLFDKVPYYISKYFTANNFMIIFPQQKERTLHEGEVFNPLKIN